ncbi:3-oxoacyl-[acyl-carrier-protein] synthase, mitochondrial [Auxenochlorella protothecoides]|uniref:beta-ketoacyl-[acyl-carrier-protein] synthase I n=1 Tax=Auxenochlorella protothecoides TaxID=3075 RepID=A0A087SI43_AUXPR|nr:3-oxoacyl-[acyl-carrier-protein] synthase, mitochondrial [Auxenochlorella protothecoides]KFM25397.1 3-oxoacyl-[acyl-carrier-protein] synthase, mitochondrial [Auxenochlorella protothecoides]
MPAAVRRVSTCVDGLRRVVVTGLGLVTPLGIGKELTWDRVLAGETGVRALALEDLPESHRDSMAQLPCRVISCVPRAQHTPYPWATPPDAKRHARVTTLALWAAAEALLDAGWRPQSEAERDATGVAIGVGMSFSTDLAEAGVLMSQGRLRRLSPHFVPRILTNSPAGAVSLAHGLRGPNHAASTACATGAHALGDAARMVALGDADAMLAGGAEACIDAVALAGFSRLKALSTAWDGGGEEARASRPFDARRDGFVLGEGAGVLAGYGMSGDAHHVTQPPPDGRGAALAMPRALRSARCDPDEVAYVNAHATSTPQGTGAWCDAVEARAIAQVFGGRLSLAVSSTKGAMGHLLGAAGAVEAAMAVLALYHGVAPPTLNLEDPEPAGLLPGLVGPTPLTLPPGAGAVLTNSFGFGGTNAALVFTRHAA